MKFINVLLLAFVLFSFTGCKKAEAPPTAQKTEEPPAYGDTIVVGSIGDASNLIPLLASDSASHDIAGLIYNGLVRYDKNLNLEGDLAESWEVSKNGLEITFHLRKGVKWHDGADFTADDVIYTYKVTIDPKTPTAYSGDFLMVKKAEVLDKYTFKVTYPKPFAPALASWGSAILPKHLLDGKEIAKSDLARHPIGTGPYKFAEWKTGEKIVLEANPEYWEGKPYIERYIYRIIPDQATLFLELKSGGVDYTGLTPLQYARQTEFAEFKKNFNKYKYLAFAYTYMGYNLTNPIFQDKRVRKAISYAIDKQELVDGVLLGLGKSASGPYKPGTWVYNDKVERYDYNPQKARELLAEAGWKDTNGDGLLDNDGKPFEFTIMTNQGNDSRAKTVEIIQKKLKEIGITVKPRVMEWASFLQRIDKKDFEAVVLGWTIGQDPDLFDIWHSSKNKPKELNFITYKNQEVDDLLTKGRETFDQEERKKYYFRIQEILADDAPYTFLYVPDALPAVHARFRGIEPAPAGIMHNFIKWYVPKGEQRHKAEQMKKEAYEATQHMIDEALSNQWKKGLDRATTNSGLNIAFFEGVVRTADGEVLVLEYAHNRLVFPKLSKFDVEYTLLLLFLDDMLPIRSLFSEMPDIDKVTMIVYSYRSNEDKYGNVLSKTKIPLIQLTIDRTTMENIKPEIARNKTVLALMSEGDRVAFIQWAKGLVDLKWH